MRSKRSCLFMVIERSFLSIAARKWLSNSSRLALKFGVSWLAMLWLISCALCQVAEMALSIMTDAVESINILKSSLSLEQRYQSHLLLFKKSP